MTPMSRFVAIADPKTDRIKLHAAGCADVARIEAGSSWRRAWPVGDDIDAAVAELDAEFGTDPDDPGGAVDVLPCARAVEQETPDE